MREVRKTGDQGPVETDAKGQHDGCADYDTRNPKHDSADLVTKNYDP